MYDENTQNVIVEGNEGSYKKAQNLSENDDAIKMLKK